MAYTLELDNPVSSLQIMLRDLGKIYTFLPKVAIDGIFGAETLEAVLLFQKELYPPVTGVVTLDVWQAVEKELSQFQEILAPPKPLRAFPEGNIFFDYGDKQGEIAMFQLMFQLLSEKLQGIENEPPTGQYTDTLQRNVQWLQKISSLPVTGQLDRQTWGRLARLYELYVTKA